MKVEIKRFQFVTWPRYQSFTWHFGWDPLILGHHFAKFGVHRPCESGDITFLICHVIPILKCHVTLWVGSLILSHHPANFGVHRSYETGNYSVCNISSISSSNSNSSSIAEVPMQRFINGQICSPLKISKSINLKKGEFEKTEDVEKVYFLKLKHALILKLTKLGRE